MTRAALNTISPIPGGRVTSAYKHKTIKRKQISFGHIHIFRKMMIHKNNENLLPLKSIDSKQRKRVSY